MHERTVEIPTADRSMETFITHPEQGGPFAPIVVYMDVWGAVMSSSAGARRGVNGDRSLGRSHGT